jgi:hypothetical protein
MRSKSNWGAAIRLSWVACLCLAALTLVLSGCDRFTAGPGQVAGTLTVGGKATAGVQVTVYGLDRAENDKDDSLLVRGTQVQETTTAADGAYGFRLNAGKYVVVPVGYAGVSRLVEVKPRETTRADFQLQP